MAKYKIAHITSVHSRYDTRIFLKMCTSLAKEPQYETYLVVADCLPDEEKNGVKIKSVEKTTGGRLSRMTKTVRKVYQKAIELGCDVYHLHDPELLPAGIKLKKRGKKIIFDSHEDVPQQMLSKSYLNRPARSILAITLSLYERRVCRKLDGVISATPYIHKKFSALNSHTEIINNFPLQGELACAVDWKQKKNQICYIGGIGSIRGIKEIVQAMAIKKSELKLVLAGEFDGKSVELEVKQHSGWKNIIELGWVDRKIVGEVMNASIAGMVIFRPVPNHINSQPNKLFEYMSAGIPVIASNFPLWQQIVEGNKCGLCVDPLNTRAIAEAIDYMVEHPEEAEEMGQNGREAVLEKYNWEIEEQKLLSFYQQVLN